MPKTACFSRKQLTEYLLGDLPEAALDQVALHVEKCVDCEATVAMLDRESDTLIESLRAPVEQKEPASAYRLAAKQAVACWRDAVVSPLVNHSDISTPAVPRLRDYELLEPLARGGMGTVYHARHLRLNRQVAVKVLPGRWLQDPAVVARFQREMQAVGSLKHPAIVQATDGGEVDGVHFLVMELIDGCDGSSLVQHLGPLPVVDACEIGRQTAEGMAYCHGQGIVHRDLKPSNVMVTQAGDVKVLDLGLARIVGPQLADDELTTVGQLMGTLDFMAPEQLENSHEVDERTDIYALGATLFKLLTGRSPHTTDSREPLLSKLHRIATDQPLPLQPRRPDAPAELCQLVDSMLSHDVAARPESMAAVANSLARLSESSDLAKRVEEATVIRQRERSERSSSQGAAAGLLPRNTKDVAPKKEGQRPNRGRRVLGWTAAALLLLATAMGVVITLQTTAGTLVIETATADVEVRVLKAGQVYRQLTLTQKANSLRLGAGEYEIELVSAADGLVIENGTYTLKRGETWLARIAYQDTAHQDKGDPTAGATVAKSSDPTYEGRTLDQWVTLLQQDRSPKQLHASCEALEKLATGTDTAAAVAAVLTAIRFHDSQSEYQLDSGETIYPWLTVSGFLAGRDQGVVVAALAQALDRPDEANEDFIFYYLEKAAERIRPFATEGLLAHVERVAADSSSINCMNALGLLPKLGPPETAFRHLVAALAASDVEVRLVAAGLLIEINSNLPLVVSTLRQVVRSGELRNRARAAWWLGDLGEAAQPALPELMAAVQEQDDEVSWAAAHQPMDDKSGLGYGWVSVKDAAIRALAEIGDKSAVPVLITEWEQRVKGRGRSMKKRTAAWNNQIDYRTRADTYDPNWVADAIEQLTGMRPESGNKGVVWYMNNLSLSRAYQVVYAGVHLDGTSDPLSVAQQLMPKASESEREAARGAISIVGTSPGSAELDVEIKLIELLAQQDDPWLILEAVLGRMALYAEREDENWQPAERAAAVRAYRECAVGILRGAKDWKTTLVPRLSEMATRGKWPNCVLLIDVLPDLEEEEQIENVLRYFRFNPVFGKDLWRDLGDTWMAWLEDDAHRTAVQRRFEHADDDDWVILTVGVLRLGLTEVVAPDALVDGFRSKPRVRGQLLQSLLRSLDDRPEFVPLVIKLLKDPVLDEVVRGRAGRTGATVEWSLRAHLCMKIQREIPLGHRSDFIPFLKSLVETDKNGESDVAQQILNEWY